MIYTIQNIPPKPPQTIPELRKESGFAQFIFLSRIVHNKGLDFAIEALAPSADQCELSIYGPAEDNAYLEKCLGLATRHGLKAEHHGYTSDPIATLSKSHFLILPTWSENFSYVIYESLCAGCPVLISDQTPWKNLQMLGGGHDLPLNLPLWQQGVKYLINMDDGDYQELRESAIWHAHRWYRDNVPQISEQYKRMFADVIGSKMLP